MKPNPFSGLAHSRKFLVLMLNIVVSGTSYFVTLLLAPDVAKHVLYIIGLLQPAVLMVIGSIASEDNANVKASATVQVAEEAAKATIAVAVENAKADILFAEGNAKAFAAEPEG